MNNKKRNWLIGIVGIIILGLVVFAVISINKHNIKDQNSSSMSSSSSNVSSMSKSSAVSTSKKVAVTSKSSSSKVDSTTKNGKILKTAPTLAEFNKIKIIDIKNVGSGKATSLNQAKDILGNPTSVTTNKLKDSTSVYSNWTYINSKNTKDNTSVSVTFNNDKAISKGISGLSVKRSKKLTLATFNDIKSGITYDQLVEKIGQPNGLTEVIGNNKEFITALYTTGLQTEDKPNTTVVANFVFNDGKLTSKNQNGLK